MNILSIVVITWNRSKQLAEALGSCFACDLPEDTEFVIIDNASTDDTEAVVSSLFKTISMISIMRRCPKTSV